MKKQIPINTTVDGCAFAITVTQPAHAGYANLTRGGGHFPTTGILEIIHEESEEPMSNARTT